VWQGLLQRLQVTFADARASLAVGALAPTSTMAARPLSSTCVSLSPLLSLLLLLKLLLKPLLKPLPLLLLLLLLLTLLFLIVIF
jgi:hypothetical protein